MLVLLLLILLLLLFFLTSTRRTHSTGYSELVYDQQQGLLSATQPHVVQTKSKLRQRHHSLPGPFPSGEHHASVFGTS